MALAVIRGADDSHLSLGDQHRVHLVDNGRSEYAAHVLGIAPQIRTFQNRKLRNELSELRCALIDELNSA